MTSYFIPHRNLICQAYRLWVAGLFQSLYWPPAAVCQCLFQWALVFSPKGITDSRQRYYGRSHQDPNCKRNFQRFRWRDSSCSIYSCHGKVGTPVGESNPDTFIVKPKILRLDHKGGQCGLLIVVLLDPTISDPAS